jgi:NADPH:quinone reductase-like Zn-dependent oxidoreductase
MQFRLITETLKVIFHLIEVIIIGRKKKNLLWLTLYPLTVAMGEYSHHKSIQQHMEVVPCSDMCGVITQLGEGVDAWKVGDRVLSTFLPEHLTGQVTEKELSHGIGYPLPGVLTTYRAFPQYGLVKCPDYMTDEQASTLPIASVTAWMALNGMRPRGEIDCKGKYVLLQGTGGVSIAGLQLAKASGAKGSRFFFSVIRVLIAC